MNSEELVQLVKSRISIGLATSLFFEQRADDSLPDIPWIFEGYVALVRDQLKWWVDDDRGRPLRVTDRQLAYPRTRLSTPLTTRSVSWSAHGGDQAKDASPISFYATLRARQSDIGNDGEFHGLHASTEPKDLNSDARALLARTLIWSRAVKVTHGNAGFAFIRSAWSSERKLYDAELFAASKRYRGIEVLDTGGTASRCKDGIKSVNWLTLVQNAWLDRIGGLETVRAKLSPAVTVHEILDGALFQAGPLPLVGDLNAGEDLSAYHEIGRVLAPIRSTNPSAFASWRDFSLEESRKWRARFDE